MAETKHRKRNKDEAPLKERVLKLLTEHRGEYLSGEILAGKLSVSRQAVWKAVRTLEAEGVRLKGVTNRGYMLKESDDRFTSAGITALLNDDARAFFRLETAAVVTSTNTLLKARGSSGEAEGLVLLAEMQTAGRGRTGRSFYSPEGSGLYMSLLLRPPYRAEVSVRITALAAVSAARAVEKTLAHFSGKSDGSEEKGSADPVRIKWVNDLYLNGKKICGILTEAALDMESGRTEYAVLGLGFNLAPPEGGFPEELRDIAGSIFETSCPPGARAYLAAAFLNDFLPAFRRLPEKEFLQEYRDRQLLIGKAIEVIEADGSVKEAAALGIDEDCRLVVRMKGDVGTRILDSGEVRARMRR